MTDDVVDGATIGRVIEEFLFRDVDDERRHPDVGRQVYRAMLPHLRQVRRAIQVGDAVGCLRNRVDGAARPVDGALTGMPSGCWVPASHPLIAHLADDGRNAVVAGAHVDHVAAGVARAPDADTVRGDTGLAAQIVEGADNVADLVLRVHHFPDGAGAHGHFPVGVRLRLLADDHQTAVAVGPAAVVERQDHETGIGKFRRVPLVEMVADAAPAVGQEDGGPGGGVLKPGGEPQVAGHAGAVAPDVDGAAFDALGGGMGYEGGEDNEERERRNRAAQDESGSTPVHVSLQLCV